MSDFDGWFAEYDSEVEPEQYDQAETAAKAAWDYQQAKIERLNERLGHALHRGKVDRRLIEQLQERGISQAGEVHEYRMENERLKGVVENLKARSEVES